MNERIVFTDRTQMGQRVAGRRVVDETKFECPGRPLDAVCPLEDQWADKPDGMFCPHPECGVEMRSGDPEEGVAWCPDCSHYATW